MVICTVDSLLVVWRLRRLPMLLQSITITRSEQSAWEQIGLPVQAFLTPTKASLNLDSSTALTPSQLAVVMDGYDKPMDIRLLACLATTVVKSN